MSRPTVAHAWPWGLLALLASLLQAAPAAANRDILSRVPLAARRGCATCHDDDTGGRTKVDHRLNPFGREQIRELIYSGPGGAPKDYRVVEWNSWSRDADSDGDGYSNGQELGDLNGDGILDRASWPERSPGLTTGDPGANAEDGADMDECLLGFDDCAPSEECIDRVSDERPSYQCVCTGSGCAPCPFGFERYEGECVRQCEPGEARGWDGECHRRCPPGYAWNEIFLCRLVYSPPPAETLVDDAWTPVRPYDPHRATLVTSCAPGGTYTGPVPAYRYAPDCTLGRVWIETDDPGAILSIVRAGTGSYGTETTCAVGPTAASPLRLPEGASVRVLGAAPGARIRAWCEPDPEAASAFPGWHASDGPVCSEALATAERINTFRLGDAELGAPGPNLLPVSLDPCQVETTSDVWLRHEATCSGVLTVTLNTLCEFDSDASVSLYPSGGCPSLTEPLTCGRSEPDGEHCRELASTAVRAGDEVLVRLAGRTRDGAVRSRTVTIECVPGSSCDDAEGFCVESAQCEDVNGEIGCVCPNGYVGDGVDPLRGGTGCVRDPAPCIQAGLDCDENAECRYRLQTDEEWVDREQERDQVPYCRCQDGFLGNGESCVARPCYEPAGGPAKCGRANSHCVALDGLDYWCECDLGYWANPLEGSDRLNPTCEAVCGDGERHALEYCDDGNTTPGDGCDQFCNEEPGYQCGSQVGRTSTCFRHCGDGVINPMWGEECDDGNVDDVDGCSSECLIEYSAECETGPNGASECVLTCPNGVLDPGEGCDDGNADDRDGCSARCQVERNYECEQPPSGPSDCATTCPDGEIDEYGECVRWLDCSCKIAGAPSSPRGLWLLPLVGAFLLRRRLRIARSRRPLPKTK